MKLFIGTWIISESSRNDVAFQNIMLNYVIPSSVHDVVSQYIMLNHVYRHLFISLDSDRAVFVSDTIPHSRRRTKRSRQRPKSHQIAPKNCFVPETRRRWRTGWRGPGVVKKFFMKRWWKKFFMELLPSSSPPKKKMPSGNCQRGFLPWSDDIFTERFPTKFYQYKTISKGGKQKLDWILKKSKEKVLIRPHICFAEIISIWS